MRKLSTALDELERRNASIEVPAPPTARPKIGFRIETVFANKLRVFFIAIYVAFALLALSTGGFPSNLSEFLAGFVIPGLAAIFLYFFYKGALSLGKNLTGKAKKDFRA